MEKERVVLPIASTNSIISILYKDSISQTYLVLAFCLSLLGRSHYLYKAIYLYTLSYKKSGKLNLF